MNKILKGALISSVIVAGYGLLFHYYNVSPHNWDAVALWLPIYVAPIWAIAGYSKLTGGDKD